MALFAETIPDSTVSNINYIYAVDTAVRTGAVTVLTKQEGQQGHAPFNGSDYCRLLHVLEDSRMTVERQILSSPLTREALYALMTDPWDQHITRRFHDSTLIPERVTTMAGDVTESDKYGIKTGYMPHMCTASTLKYKFSPFESIYGTFLNRFETSRQNVGS